MKQRVHQNLGYNQTKDHDELYLYIETNLGVSTKKCSMGCKGNKYNIVHDGCRECPIRQFRLYKIRKNDDGTIQCGVTIPLQGNCKTCDDRWRQARLQTMRDNRKGKSNEEIYNEYVKMYHTDQKVCSMCNRTLNHLQFGISRGMECGLHNTCKICQKNYGGSIQDREIIYATDGCHKVGKNGLSDDHIFPLSLGGSNYKENRQLIPLNNNLSKGNKLVFNNINEISERMLNDRYQQVLLEAKENGESIETFKIKMSKVVHQDILNRLRMNDEGLKAFYRMWNKNNNTRKNIERCVAKLKEYGKSRNIYF